MLLTTYYILTRIVNFPVASSLSSGSQVGLRLTSPSRCLVASCCSYKLTALEEFHQLVSLLKHESDLHSSLLRKWNYAMHYEITRRLFLWTKFTQIFKEDIFTLSTHCAWDLNNFVVWISTHGI